MIKKNRIKNFFIRSIILLLLIFVFCQVVMIVVFLDNLKMIILPNIFLLIIIGILVYYYGFITIYKVQQEENKLVFYSCLKKYIITEKIEIKKTLKGYYISKDKTKILLLHYMGTPIKRNQCWTDKDIIKIEQLFTSINAE